MKEGTVNVDSVAYDADADANVMVPYNANGGEANGRDTGRR